LVIGIIGIVALCGGIQGIQAGGLYSGGNSFQGTSSDPAAYATALFKIFFTMDGWNNLNYSIDELKDPIRNLPRAAIGGISITVFLYVLANVAYFAVVPKQTALTSAQVLAADFFRIAFPNAPAVNVVIPVLISLSTFGCLCCMTYSASRVIFEAAKEGYLPFAPTFGRAHPYFRTPIAALCLHVFVTMLIMVVVPAGQAYSFLIDVTSFPVWMYYGISVIGLLLLRRRVPHVTRPFKCPWPVAVFFIAAAVFLSVFPFISVGTPNSDALPYWLAPFTGLVAMLLTIPLWYWQIVKRRGLDTSPNTQEQAQRQRVKESEA